MNKEEINDIKNILVQIDFSINLIEVKGESVQHLFTSRLGLNKVFELIQKLEKELETKENKKEV